MRNEAKALTFLLVILLLISLSLSGYIFSLFQKEQQKVSLLQEKLNDADIKLRIVEKNIEDYKQKINGLETQLKTSQEQLSSLKKELENERLLKKEIEEKYAELSEQINQKEKEREELKKDYELTKNELQNLQVQLRKLEEEKLSLENKLRSLEEKYTQVNLGTVVVEQSKTKETPKVTTQTKRNIEGKVLVVNKEYDFAVVSLGSRDGIKLGDKFSVYREGKYLGDLEVERVQETMSAGKFLSDQLKEKIKEQDKVMLKE